MQYREYQQQARFWVNQKLNNSRHPLLVMPTGTGKSFVAGNVVKDRIALSNRLLLLVPQLEIHEQFLTLFSEMGINTGYINDEGVMGRNRDVYICMYQSLDNLIDVLPEKFCRSFTEIIIDEAHHSSAQSFRNIFKHFPNCRRFGMTATAYRMDNQPLGEFYTDIFEPIKMSESIEKGYLCKPVVIIPEQYKEFVPEIGVEFNAGEQKEHIEEKKIIGDMVATYKNVFDGLPVIVPCSTHAHAKAVTRMFSTAGWNVDHIHSKMGKVDRKIILRRIRTGKTNILVTVGVGVEGMDIPGLYGIIWLRFTESLTVFMQFNGRAMRPAPGKKYFIIVDPVGNSVIHGRPDIDRKWSLTTDYKPGQDVDESMKMKLCPSCSVMVGIANISCWVCGYNFETGMLNGVELPKRKRKLPKMVNGELVFLDEENNTEVQDGNYKNTNIDVFDSNNSSDRLGNRGNKETIGNNEQSSIPESEKIENNEKNSNILLTKTEKMSILSRDLTGMRLKNKFKEGLKWL